MSINARIAFLANKPLKSFSKYRNLISDSGLQAGSGSPTSTRKYHFMMPYNRVIKEKVSWGSPPVKWLNNKIRICAIKIDGVRLVNKDIIICEKDKKRFGGDDIPYESRWFDIRSSVVDERTHSCSVTEWIKSKTDICYSSKKTFFDYTTGDEK